MITKLGLFLSEEDESPPINPLILGEALRFTSQTKLSPKWNRIDKQMVRNENFLSEQVIHNVYPELKVSESMDQFQVHLTLRADVKRWPKLTDLKSLDIDER